MHKVTYKGITYRSLQLACDRLGIHPGTVYQQYKNIPFDQAIEQILKNKKRNSCTDHLGNEFESIRAMAEFYHIPYSTLFNRLKRKWSLKRALTTPNGKPRGKYVNKCIDHLGNEFESRKAMAEFYHIPYLALNNRLRRKRKWSLERALTTPVHNCTDHLGNEFECRETMAEFYHIPYLLLNRRLARGWSLERALTTPNGKPRGKYAKSKV